MRTAQITVELKNDLAITGTLHSVDQYLNIKLNNTRVVNEQKYPHMVSARRQQRQQWAGCRGVCNCSCLQPGPRWLRQCGWGRAGAQLRWRQQEQLGPHWHCCSVRHWTKAADVAPGQVPASAPCIR
jgi:hypothetical protein